MLALDNVLTLIFGLVAVILALGQIVVTQLAYRNARLHGTVTLAFSFPSSPSPLPPSLLPFTSNSNPEPTAADQAPPTPSHSDAEEAATAPYPTQDRTIRALELLARLLNGPDTDVEHDRTD
ncbi:MAG: hypothetical protein M1818_007900 [Claussenomyces sp. TS43310]|nr:MAG: hypothetical protein M1818_007900 [Claussenomyces sp. TS43310]